jgi:peptide-methionine (S)-S-oxide reductase
VPGVVDAISGYEGGVVDHPTYKQICSGTTGHAEAVLVTFDPEVVAFETLLEEFWRHHDPTTRNRQGPDRGTQYRSAVFVHDQAQEKTARASLDEYVLAGRGVPPALHGAHRPGRVPRGQLVGDPEILDADGPWPTLDLRT